ncbi:diadenosine tetraphosphate hydrolase [Bacillus sp. M6-12]|nr:diadenosine tetraphosphate hydrolase [Bacillus sp. M6-12]PLS17038.1 diadenosine tetraphosphate hydrolase [Bacillus sp. M6-12]
MFADGREIETSCLSCAVANSAIEATGGTIYETNHFHVHQDIAYPIAGLMIVASKRHFYTMDELTNEEAEEYIFLIRKLRMAQREVLGVEHVYYFYNEDTTHHFHLWMVPRYQWMNKLGRSVESVRPVLRHSRETMSDEANLKQVMAAADSLRAWLLKA